jgi:hypothetical protein
MAIETKVRSSSLMPIKNGAMIEVTLTDTAAATTATTSAAIPLGKAYRSVKPVAIAGVSNAATPAMVSAAAAVPDNANVKLVYSAGAAGSVTVVATFECEV